MGELPPKTIIALEDSGMSDRVQLLLCGYRTAEELGRPFAFVWVPSSWCGAGFDDLFVQRSSFIVLDKDPCPDLPILDFRATYWPLVQLVMDSMDRGFHSLKFHAFPQWHNPKDFGENGLIDFSPKVKEAGKEMAAKLTDAIGVHIRATDYRNKMPPLSHYRSAIDCFPKDRPIFIASDEAAIKREFSDHYGSRAITRNPFGFVRSDPAATIDGAVDLYLLRQCRSLVYSAYSGFSRLAIRSREIPSVQVLGIGENPHTGIGCIGDNQI